MAQATVPEPGMTAAGRYASLQASRSPYERRAEEAAMVTIPALFPPEGSNGTDLYRPFQSLGGRGVNMLSAKLLLALFPPGSNFFRLAAEDQLDREIEQLEEQTDEDIRGKVEKALQRVERKVRDRFETSGTRAVTFEELKQLIVAGNVLSHTMDTGKTRYFTLRNYVVKRDAAGEVLEIVVKEKLSRMALPERVRALVGPEPEPQGTDESSENTVEMYTRVSRIPTPKSYRWRIYQEVDGAIVPGSTGWYAADKCPWQALRWTPVAGEDYGRSYVEDYLGDLMSLESLNRSIVEFAGAAARILYLLDYGSSTDPKDISDAPSGAVRRGNAKEVSVLGLEKFYEFQAAMTTVEKIERRLAEAFLLMTGLPRDAERVTAEEIRRIAQELEQALGGVYSILAQELQLPLANIIMHQMKVAGELPELPSKDVKPQILTGVEALGRQSDLQKWQILMASLANAGVPPQEIAVYVNLGALLQRQATALGLDVDGVIRSDKEVQALRAQAAEQEMANKLGPEAMRMMQAAAQPTEGATPNG